MKNLKLHKLRKEAEQKYVFEKMNEYIDILEVSNDTKKEMISKIKILQTKNKLVRRK